MAVMVEEVTMSKSGKALRVKLGGTWYNAFLDSGLNGAKGKMIEAQIQSSDKYGPSITGWKEVVGVQIIAPTLPVPAPQYAQPTAAAPVTRTREPEYAKPAPVGTVAPYWLPMASNTVNAAIVAGLIREPNNVSIWVRAVRIAVEAEQRNAEDPIPF